MFIFIYLKGELSYDQFHKDSERIYRVVKDFVDSQGERLPDATTPPALAYALKNELPEVEVSTNVFPNWGNKFLFGTDEKNKFYEEKWIRVDSTFFDVFSFKLKYGETKGILDDPNQMVISESKAIKYFGKADVIGETLTFFGSNERVFTIVGVLEDIPENSHFKFDFLSKLYYENLAENWGWYNYYTYIKLAPKTSIASVEPKIQEIYEKAQGEREYYNIYYTQAITDIHLHSNLKWELETNGDIINVYIFMALALFVLIISCLNYLNLTVAKSIKRFKEVGVRKVFGARKASLIAQFMVETLVVIFIALVLGSVVTEFLFQNLGDLLGRNISLFNDGNWVVLLVSSTVILFIGFFTGLYPSLYLSSFKVVLAVKGLFNHSGKSALSFRRVLLVIQFSISSFMILGAITVYQQLQHIKNTDKGFGIDQIVVLENVDAVENQKVLKEELMKLASISNAGVSSGIIGGLNWTFRMGYPDEFVMNYVAADPEFMETMDFEFLEGRNFSRDMATDSVGLTVIVNETGFKELGLSTKDIGQTLPLSVENDTIIREGTVIGVVKDFHFTDFKSEIKPFAFFFRDASMNNMSLKLSTNNLSNSLEDIEAIWDEHSNELPFEYFFLDQTFADHYKKESQLSQILLYLTVLALFIAFMGMFAIVNITLKDRVKEIAIRKVLGVSLFSVTHLISKRFIFLVLIANLIACPLAYYVLNSWLQGFAYRISMGAIVFVLAVGSTLIVAWLTVSLQSFSIALSNPTKSLKQD